MKTGDLENPDALKDRKHNLPSGVSIPAEPKKGQVAVDLTFCEGCRRMTTNWEISRYGCCPKCRSHRFRGGYETTLEHMKLQWWIWTNNWRITGKWKKQSTN